MYSSGGSKAGLDGFEGIMVVGHNKLRRRTIIMVGLVVCGSGGSKAGLDGFFEIERKWGNKLRRRTMHQE